MRRLLAVAVAGVFGVVVALSAGCAGAAEPNSLTDDPGYHVRGDAVYYLNPFPGKAFRVEDADSSTFEAFDRTYGKDRERVFINGHLLQGARADSFRPLERPGLSRDRDRVYQRDQPISTDPDHFEMLPGELARDRVNVYWSDGTVLSEDPTNFVIISDTDQYLYAKDSREVFVNDNVIAGAAPATFRVLDGAYTRDDDRIFYFDAQITDADPASFYTVKGPYAVDGARVYWMGRTIEGADPDSFEVLNANFECSADATRAFYRDMVIADADPATFPERPVTGCSTTSISFAD